MQEACPPRTTGRLLGVSQGQCVVDVLLCLDEFSSRDFQIGQGTVVFDHGFITYQVCRLAVETLKSMGQVIITGRYAGWKADAKSLGGCRCRY